MKLSLNWLTDFTDISDITPEKLAELLTERVAEVEHITKTGCDIEKVVTGKIEKIGSVEGADKIQLTTVDIGSEKLQIICGAKNIHEGAKVPIALVGCELPGGFTIEKRKIRGVESNGMICSESELGLAEKSEGIMLLSEDTQIGVKFSEICSSDTVFEIDNHAITHRPDLFSQIGFAREIAVLQNAKCKIKNAELPQYEKNLDVEVAEPKFCRRYCGLKISGIKVQPSAKKIRDRLEACGVRAINNVVDATNYVMLELGQPMHAFDTKKLAGGWVIVRKAKAGEKLITIDGEERELKENMLVIADAEKPVALAGVMGGASSEVDEATTEIILESANFGAVTVRQTSIALGLRSESSLRFEKHLDPELPPQAISRFLEIMRETCPDLNIEAGADVKNFESEKRVIRFSLKRLEKKFGLPIEKQKAVGILQALEFKVDQEEGEELSVEVPSFRAGRDIEQEDDLIEEVIRHLGYADLPAEFPSVQMEAPERNSDRELADELRDMMVGFGFHETATLAMVSKDLLQKSNTEIEKAAALQNPPSEEFKILRPKLLPSLLDAAEKNIKHEKSFCLFELSNVFEKDGSGRQEFVGVVVGEKSPFNIIRGIAESLFQNLKISVEFKSTSIPSQLAHPGRVALVSVGGKVIGEVAELHPAIAQNFELPLSAYFALDFEALAKLTCDAVIAEPLPKFPGVPRDIAIVVPKKTLAIDVEKAILSADERIVDLKLFDVYTGDGVEAGMKSLAFSFGIRDPEKTLEDAESEKVLQKIVADIERVGGKLRS